MPNATANAPLRPPAEAPDRRAVTRRPYQRWSCCYIDGTRFDTESLDISPNGVFLETRRPVPTGAPVVIVFDQDETPIYLVGRVARRQVEPPLGVGVAWVRAVTATSKETLITFLEDVLGLGPHLPTPNLYQSDEDGRFFCEFTHVQSPDSEPPTGPDLAKPASEPQAPGPLRQDRHGPLTQWVWNPETTVPVEVSITATIGTTPCEVTLVRLGMTRMVVRASVAPIDRRVGIDLALPIPVADALVTIHASAELQSIRRLKAPHDCELQLGVLAIDDAELPGGFEHYLKRVACAALTDPKAQ